MPARFWWLDRAERGELGLYGLGFTVYVLLTGLAKSLVWTPYTSLFPRLEPDEQKQYTASVTAHLGAFTLLSSAVLMLMGLVCFMWFPQKAFAGLFVTLAPVTTLLLLREHVRYLCLARLRIGEVLIFDSLVSALQFAGVLMLYASDRLTATAAYWGMAAASGMSLAWLVHRHDQLSWKLSALIPHWQKNWAISRWITPTAMMLQVGNQGPRWFLELVYGLPRLGLFMAAQIVIQIANPLLLGNANYFGPSSATIFAKQGKYGLWRYTVHNTAFLCVLVGGVALAAGLLGPSFLSWIYGSDFRVGSS